jgi:glycosyltransferase involved in cell wall biosynthesis
VSIGIVMAARNYARFLPEAVESVLAQTYRDWHLLIVDDGSTDGTANAAAPYLADDRIRYAYADRLGQARAKNLGLRLVPGEFVAFLDADDRWLPAKLERQLAAFDDPRVGVCHTLRDLMDERGKRLPSPTVPLPPSGDVRAAIFARNFVCFSSAVVRRELIHRVGSFDETLDLAIDYDLWQRAATHCHFACIPEQLTLYRTGHGNLSQKLAQRIATATDVMNRRGDLPSTTVADGYASTYRQMGYLLRGGEKWNSLRWYLRALAWPSKRLQTLKEILAVPFARGEVSDINDSRNR